MDYEETNYEGIEEEEEKGNEVLMKALIGLGGVAIGAIGLFLVKKKGFVEDVVFAKEMAKIEAEERKKIKKEERRDIDKLYERRIQKIKRLEEINKEINKLEISGNAKQLKDLETLRREQQLLQRELYS